MRRKIGPAYERAPAERTGRWFLDNLFRLFAAALAVFAFCFVVDWLFDDVFNFLERGVDEETPGSFSAASSVANGAKVVGSVLITYLILRARRVGL
jgi:hypothetical protein